MNEKCSIIPLSSSSCLYLYSILLLVSGTRNRMLLCVACGDTVTKTSVHAIVWNLSVNTGRCRCVWVQRRMCAYICMWRIDVRDCGSLNSTPYWSIHILFSADYSKAVYQILNEITCLSGTCSSKVQFSFRVILQTGGESSKHCAIRV